MFELVRLKARGFRGFADLQEFLFDHPVVLLWGENHLGKSSTLNAVEWCLFGNECLGKKTGIRERVDWEIANRYLQQGDVVVAAEFRGPNGIYKITREQSLGRKRGAQKVTVLLPDGSQVQGDEAETLLYALFRSSFQDFMATVYQHQEAIRAILTQEPRDRNDAIDRLMGLSPYREVLKGITGANLEQAVNHMEGRRDEFRKRCEQTIRTLDNLISEERAKAVTEGITQEEMTEQAALNRAKDVAKAVGSLAQELGASDFQVQVPAAFGEIAEFREWVKNQADNLWARSPDVLKQTALGIELGKIVPLKGEYQQARTQETEALRERDNFVKQFGDAGALVKAIQELKQSIGQLEDDIRKANAKANLVREAIQYLRETSPETGPGQCPLCGADAPQLLRHLEIEWEEKVRAEVEGLEQQKVACQAKLEETESLMGVLRTSERNLGEARSRCEECVNKIAVALEREVGKEDDPLALLGKRLEQINLELKSISEAITNKRAKISDIYAQLGKLRTVHEILIHEQKKSVIERIWGSSEFSELEETLNEVSQFAEDIRAIRSALAEAAREEAETKIHAAEVALDKYFCCIARHPAIPGLVMEVTEDRRTGLNSYNFKSKDGTDPAPILSQGDLNCLALSLFLGLSEATGETQRFGFLMLDDPTQSLGPEMKRELVRVLGDIADRRKLIIATPDREFKELLVANIAKNKAIYNFVAWTTKAGPQVTGTI